MTPATVPIAILLNRLPSKATPFHFPAVELHRRREETYGTCTEDSCLTRADQTSAQGRNRSVIDIKRVRDLNPHIGRAPHAWNVLPNFGMESPLAQDRIMTEIPSDGGILLYRSPACTLGRH
jgi:hypothetical protein